MAGPDAPLGAGFERAMDQYVGALEALHGYGLPVLDAQTPLRDRRAQWWTVVPSLRAPEQHEALVGDTRLAVLDLLRWRVPPFGGGARARPPRGASVAQLFHEEPIAQTCVVRGAFALLTLLGEQDRPELHVFRVDLRVELPLWAFGLQGVHP